MLFLNVKIMKLKYFKISRLFGLCSLLFLLVACSKNTIIINEPGGSGSGGDSSGSTSGGVLVTFHASIESRNMLRSMSPIRKGIEARLFAFDGFSSDVTRSPLENGLYVSSSPGILAGVAGYKMYLPNGVYNFYGVSDHTSTYLTDFTNGKSEFLFNGIDYLWWQARFQDVSESQVSVPIVFLHSATQVVVEVAEGAGLTLNKLLSATITPPMPGAQMDLYTGVIPPATIYDRADKMGINGLLAQYIMLPLVTNEPMTLTLEVQIAGEPAPRDYIVQIPVPDGELKAGNSYLFRAIINENTVTFNTVGIKNWVEVDETGNPLYPTQD